MLRIARTRFLVLGGCPSFGINGSLDSPEKKFSIKFSKTDTKICLSLHNDAASS